MKIIFSNYDDRANPFYGGGGAGAIHEVARRLVPRHEVTVLTGRFPGCRNETSDGVLYARVGRGESSPRLGQLGFHFSLPGEARRRRFDLWIESLTPPFSTACLQLFTRKPVSVLTQNLPGLAMARKYKLPFHWAEKLGLKTYRYGIALTPFIKGQLARANSRMQVEVIPNGVDPALTNQEASPGQDHLLFLGRLDLQQKGLDLLLRAYEGAAGDAAVPLVIAGSGIADQEARLRSLCQASRCSSRIRLVGRVTGPAKDDAFRRAMAFAMPSRFEGFPLTLLEAFCWSLPVVLFAIPELNWIPDECCLKVAPFDTAAFGAALRRLVENPELRQRLGRNGKAWARRFGWDSIAADYENFFARIAPA